MNDLQFIVQIAPAVWHTITPSMSTIRHVIIQAVPTVLNITKNNLSDKKDTFGKEKRYVWGAIPGRLLSRYLLVIQNCILTANQVHECLKTTNPDPAHLGTAIMFGGTCVRAAALTGAHIWFEQRAREIENAGVGKAKVRLAKRALDKRHRHVKIAIATPIFVLATSAIAAGQILLHHKVLSPTTVLITCGNLFGTLMDCAHLQRNMRKFSILAAASGGINGILIKAIDIALTCSTSILFGIRSIHKIDVVEQTGNTKKERWVSYFREIGQQICNIQKRSVRVIRASRDLSARKPVDLSTS